MSVGTGDASVCGDPGADDADCLGLTPKRVADLNCDGLVNNVDLQFLVAVVMMKAGGPGTADVDGDGRLNFCDDDSDDDGAPDATDCALLDPAVHTTANEVCDGIDNDCDDATDEDPAVLCDDGDPCTADGCGGAEGCAGTPLTGALCDDALADTTDDACLDGLCVGLPDPDSDGIANSGYPLTCAGGLTEGCNDNCPADANPDQADGNGDGAGDACTCYPDCDGKTCGPDGCGGSCGSCAADPCEITECIGGGCVSMPVDCDDGDICTADSCGPGGCAHAPEPGPCQWPGQWLFHGGNPVLTPTAGDPDQGADNVYAADILKHAGLWWMWYGGQGADGHDGIFLARSTDLVTWQKHPTWGDPLPVVDHGAANHVNDPSVVYVGGTFYMYYTEAPTGENDQIHLATSGDGVTWIKQGVVLDVGAPGSWEPSRVGRPSVLYEGGEFRMWYDGQIYGVARHVGYATSPDGSNWTKHPGNPVVLHEGAIDVDRVGAWYVMLAESGSGTRLYVAKDPVSWQYVGFRWGKSGAAYDAYGQVTPFLLVDGGAAVAVFFGGASDSCWCKNRIAVAFPGVDVAGCAGCLAGQPSCQAACDAAGSALGLCGAPGSVDPDACCTCCDNWACEAAPVDCSGCLGSFDTCATACQAAGYQTGTCGYPGSTDPESCCTCEPWTDCQGCLQGLPSCAAACQAQGITTGSCVHPASTNPNQCCECNYDNCEGCLGSYSNCADACHHAGKPDGWCASPQSTNPGNCCGCAPDTGCEGCLAGHPTCMAACQAAGASGGWCAVPGSGDPGNCCACF